MFQSQNPDSFPLTFEQLSLFETRLLILAFAVFLVFHTISFICRMLGIRQNWIRALFRLMKRSRKSTVSQ